MPESHWDRLPLNAVVGVVIHAIREGSESSWDGSPWEALHPDGEPDHDGIVLFACLNGSHAPGTIFIGSAFGGPIYTLTVGQIPAKDEAAYRNSLRDQYDAEQAESWGVSVADYRKDQADGVGYECCTRQDCCHAAEG